MFFNLLINTGMNNRPYYALTEVELNQVLNAYFKGETWITISGKKFSIHDPSSFRIFSFEAIPYATKEQAQEWLSNQLIQQLSGHITVGFLLQFGKELTSKYLSSGGWGSAKANDKIEIDDIELPWSFINQTIKEVAKPRFDAKQYADSVEAAFKELNDQIKIEYKKVKNGQEEDGDKLMRQSFSVGNPLFQLADTTTDNGKNIQQGYMEIFAGSMRGIRNPKAHKNLEIEKKEAVEKIILASHLMNTWEKRLK